MESIKKDKEKLLTIPKGFYKDNKYDVDIDITGESVDTRVRQATKFALLQAITTDPTVTQDPLKKKILFSIAEDGGVNPNDFFELEVADITNMTSPEMQAATSVPGRAGGGVSAPELGKSIPGQNPLTL